MSIANLAPVAITAGLLLVVAVLRTMAMARRADEQADLHWGELTHLESASGVAFFPTTDARLELELAIYEALELEMRVARRTRHAGRARVRVLTSAV